jgi:STE24 endopeptidase
VSPQSIREKFRALALLSTLLLLVWLLATRRAQAQSPPSPAASSAQTPAQNPAAPGVTQPREENKEIKAYTLPPDKYAQAVAFARARYTLYFIDAFYGFLILLLVLGWRIAPRFRDWAEGAPSAGQRPRRRFLQVAIYAPLLSLLLGVLGLPTGIYGQWLERHYQQSVESWGAWLWDWGKGQIIGIVIGVLLIWILYGIIRRSPRRWWFYFWLASIPIVVFLLFISPVVIDPLFYKFEPLAKTQPELVAEITKVVQRAGMNIPPDRMFLMKASEKLNSLNAYVTGVGASKRVVVWDTTIKRMTTDETVSVFGHEMGHYVLGHVWKGILFFSGVLLVFLYLGYLGLGWALGRWGARWQIRGPDDLASLPILFLLVSIFAFLASPVTNGFSRYQEHQADVYELEVIHGIVPNWRQVAVQAEQILGEVDLSDPDPNLLIEFWLYTHPSQKERIEFELNYDPWGKGEQPQFVK